MKNKITGVIVALFTMLAFNTAKAQTICMIDNQGGFPVDIKFQNFDSSCSNSCTMANSINVPNGGTTPLAPCTSCPCKQVELIDINGTSIPSVFASNINGPFVPTVINVPSNPWGYTSLWFNGTNFVIQ